MRFLLCRLAAVGIGPGAHTYLVTDMGAVAWSTFILLMRRANRKLNRGVGNFILSRVRANPGNANMHFYSSSGGNAGLACVHAARSLGFPASVVVPLSTKPLMISKLRAAGATDVIQEGASWAYADRHLREVVLAENPNGSCLP
jgi:cysteine synthase